MIIGITGPICAGKTEMANILNKEYGYETLSFGNEVRKEACKKGLEIRRDNLQTLGADMIFKFGNQYWARRLVSKIEKGKDYAVEGFRDPGEVSEFRKIEEFVLVGITASNNVREKRWMNKRLKEGDIVSPEAFERADARDLGLESGLHGQSSAACYDLIEYEIENDIDSIGNLKDRVRIMMGEYLGV